MIIQSFRHVGLTLKVDSSEDHMIRVKYLSNLVVSDWKEGGVECNLNRLGKTSEDLIDLDAEDDNMFDGKSRARLRRRFR